MHSGWAGACTRYRHQPALRPPQIFLHTPTATGCPSWRVSCAIVSGMSDTGTPDRSTRKLQDSELRQLVSAALVGLTARPLSITTEQLSTEQLAGVCQALGVSPVHLAQLSIVATQRGPQLVLWSHE